MATPNPDDPTETLPNFLSTIVKYDSCLGHGGFGVVLRAVDKFENYTAVKFIFPTEEDDRERQQTLRECNITRELKKHVNIVQTINAVANEFTAKEMETNFNLLPPDARYTLAKHIERARHNKAIQAICIQTELCGENLRQWLNVNHRIEDILVQLKQVEITKNIIVGVKYLHDNKLIHRDLKPENIMFSNRNYELPVKIGDFGLCRRIHSDQSRTSPLTKEVGTKTYMAPEIRSRKDYTQQADLFSLGLIIWEVLHFQKVDLFDRLVYDQEESLVKEHEYVSGVRELIINFTKRKPENRMQNMKGVLSITKSWLETVLLNKQIIVKNSEELRLCCTFPLGHCQITVLEGEYIGPFILRGNNLKVIGSGMRTVLKGSNSEVNCFSVIGNDCSISNLSIVLEQNNGMLLMGSRNVVENIDFSGSTNNWRCLIVRGDANKLQKLKFFRSRNGIRMYGSNNVLNEICLEDIDACGIYVDCFSNNVIMNVSGTNVRQGIVIQEGGGHNHVSNINLVKDSSKTNFVGLYLAASSPNLTAENITCTGYRRDKGDWGLIIKSQNSSVEGSQCGPVSIRGDNATLTNTDCGDEIELGKGIKGTRLLQCRGKKLTTLSNVSIKELSDCQFGSPLLQDENP